MSKLADFRKEKDEFFRTQPQSPLLPEQRRGFHGLTYFDENRSLVIEAPLEPPAAATEVRMDTTGGGEHVYHRAGVLRFRVDGQPAQLTLYASAGQHGMFLPFRDATSGKETYGAGRYLDVEPSHGGRIVVDFNFAYNPYCAYNEKWNCPLPPVENWLRVPIRAGEKDFPGRAGH